MRSKSPEDCNEGAHCFNAAKAATAGELFNLSGIKMGLDNF